MSGGKKRKSEGGGNSRSMTGAANSVPDDDRKLPALEFHPTITDGDKQNMLQQVGQGMPRCSKCSVGVGYERSYFFLGGCKHILCGSCFVSVGHSRGCDPWYQCPDGSSCFELSYGYYDAKLRHGQRRSDSEIRLVGEQKVLAEPDRRTDSFRYYKEQKREYRRTHTAFQVSYNNDGKVETISTLVPNGTTGIELSGEQEDALTGIGMKLHSTLLTQDKREQGQKPTVPFPSVCAVMDDIKTHCGTFRRFLHGIATGDDLKESIGEEADEYDHLDTRPSWAAAEILRAPTNPNKPGLFAQANAQLLNILGAADGLKKHLSKFRLCANKEAIRLADAEAVNAKIAEGWDLSDKIWDLLIILYDNIGFKRRGAKPGYDQYTAVKLESIPYDELKAVKVYSSDPNERLSRERKDWDDVRSKHRGERKARLFLVTKEERERYSNRVFNTYQFVMKAYSNFPTLEKCRAAAEAWETDKTHRDWNRTRISAEFGDRPEVDEGQETSMAMTTSEVPEDEVNGVAEDDISGPETEAVDCGDGSMHEVPLHADLNSLSTVKFLMRYARSLWTKVTSATTDGEDRFPERSIDGQRPYIFDGGIFMGGDGSPSAAFHTIYDAYFGDGIDDDDDEVIHSDGDAGDDESEASNDSIEVDNNGGHPFRRVWNFSGGLHTLMQTMKGIGRAFRYSHLESLIEAWRDSPKQKEWVLCPSDPTQALVEKYQMYSGVLSDAIEKAAMAKANEIMDEADSSDSDGDASDENRGDGSAVEISPVDLHNHMIQRAKDHPLAMLVLMQMRFDEIVFMLVDAEKTGANGSDPQLFRTAMAFSAYLYAVTGSNKYVRIVTENKVWWECASDADRVVYNEFLLTRKLKGSGKRIYMDRLVEWTVKEIRSYLGKFSSGENMHSQLTKTLLSLNERSKIKKELRDSQGDSSFEPTTHEVELSTVYYLSRVWSDECNLWGNGPVRVGKMGSKMPDESSEGETFLSADKAYNVHPDSLYLITTAEDRLVRYLAEYYTEGELHQVQRPHSKVDLRNVPIISSDYEERQAAAKDWMTSTDKDRINQVATRDDIDMNLAYINSRMKDKKDHVPIPPRGKNKPVHAAALAEARLKEKDQRWCKKSFLPDEESAVVDQNQAKSVKTELKHFFYDLTKSTKEKYKQKMVKIQLVASEDGIDGDDDEDNYDGMMDDGQVHQLTAESTDSVEMECSEDRNPAWRT